jgi:colanic acid/amylovoran biosynthesis glycosyltransferase
VYAILYDIEFRKQQGRFGMNNCLILITKKYPFDRGEEFIENEVPLLAKTFQHIILIATSVSDRAQQTRQVPNNVEVHYLRASQIRRSLLPYAACSAVLPLPRIVTGNDRTQARASLRKKLFCSYFLAKSEQVYKKCRAILSKAHLEQYDGVTFYSYWLYDTAMAAAKLKREFGLKKQPRRQPRTPLRPLRGSKSGGFSTHAGIPAAKFGQGLSLFSKRRKLSN